jgi:hypothetical protein
VLNKVRNKVSSITNSVIGKAHLFLENNGAVSPLPFSVFRRIENAMEVDLPYPVNFDPKDAPLFSHYNNYRTGNEEVFKLHNVNVSKKGVVFKGLNNFGPALPHPTFRNTFGLSYIIGQYLNSKQLHASSVKSYILIYDFWSEKNYYHWLIDTLPRLLVVKEELKKGEYTLLLPSKPAKFLVSTLSYFDINNFVEIDDNEYITVDNLLMPNYLAGSGHIHPKKVSEVKSFLENKIEANNKFQRIYVSRSRQKTRKLSNEKEVISLLKQFGFETVYFEDMTFEEQVSTVKGAKVLVSGHGANLTNTMFMQEGAGVLELIRKDKPNFCYWALANVARLKYNYQLCDVEKGDNLVVDIDKLKNNLSSILK